MKSEIMKFLGSKKKVGEKNLTPILTPVAKYCGAIDNQWGPIVRGWASELDRKEPVWVSILGDGVVKIVEAKEMREDLLQRGLHNTGQCGFNIDFGKRLSKPVQVTIINKVFDLPMSRPYYQNKPIFFMHIAKTAGSSLNDFFIKHFGEKQAVMHIEGISDWATIANHRFVSGHVGYQRVSQKLNLDNYIKVTFVRNPVDQLVSHFNWVRHLSEPEKKDFLDTHPQIIKEISEKLCNLDFSDPVAMKQFVSSLKPVELSLFENTQCRYFYQSSQPGKMYQQSDYQQAIKNMEKFDLVGSTEHFDSDVVQICRLAGIMKEWKHLDKVNVNKYSYGFDKSNLELIEAISPLIKYDLALYEKVISKR